MCCSRITLQNISYWGIASFSHYPVVFLIRTLPKSIHWGLVMHFCVSELNHFGAGNDFTLLHYLNL